MLSWSIRPRRQTGIVALPRLSYSRRYIISSHEPHRTRRINGSGSACTQVLHVLPQDSPDLLVAESARPGPLYVSVPQPTCQTYPLPNTSYSTTNPLTSQIRSSHPPRISASSTSLPTAATIFTATINTTLSPRLPSCDFGSHDLHSSTPLSIK